MSHTLSKILVHIVFSTKNRVNSIPECRLESLHSYIAKIVLELGGIPYRVGGITNHIHIAMSLPRTIAISKIMETIKKSSSKWMKEGENAVANFYWQPGYGIFSLGDSQLPKLINYINNQQKHHQKISYDNELKDICIKYKIKK